MSYRCALLGVLLALLWSIPSEAAEMQPAGKATARDTTSDKTKSSDGKTHQATDGQPRPNADDEPTARPRVGSYRVAFTERSRLSSLKAMASRFRWRLDSRHRDYTITEEQFAVHVPRDYDPKTAYGLFVFISPNATGDLPKTWQPVLERHKLIWVAAHNSGNKRSVWIRLGLALDAVHNMSRLYNIDDDRVYIAGVSGGGRTASRLGLMYADVFDGAMPIIGADYFRNIKVPGEDGKYWPARLVEPDAKMLKRARHQSRYVLITGEDDYNRKQTEAIFEQGYRKDKFAYITYIEVPGMGHTYPPGSWLHRGIEALDQPLVVIREKRAVELAQREARAEEDLNRAKGLIKVNLARGYMALQAIVKDHPGTEAARRAAVMIAVIRSDKSRYAQVEQAIKEAEAQQQLSLAHNYVKAGVPDAARKCLQSILADYPTTSAAGEAREMLTRLGS